MIRVDDAYIEVKLDPFLIFKSAGIEGETLGNNTFRFPIGEILPGANGAFPITVEVSCDAVLGQTHCSEVHIFPDSLCVPIDPTWTGASIAVDGSCEGDSVILRIENVGNGLMVEANNFVVTEDVLMLRQGTFQLNPAEMLELTYPANGATYRLAAEQEMNHPGFSMPAISIEGCGGINISGLVNAFPQDDGNIFEDIDCQENRGSYDPNDKSASPSGWGGENYLAKNADIEYKIRFQNTGTDTAFKVVIKDTLSQFLDAQTVIPGASSHDYIYQQIFDSSLNVTTIQFTFNDILLPDSTTNQEGSNGFIKFKIAQNIDLSDGTRLENKAAIFFDFNEPVITNTAYHTIGLPFGRVITDTKEIISTSRNIAVHPNPFFEKTTFKIGGKPIKEGIITLYDISGKVILQQHFSGNTLDLYQNVIESGFYFYKIKDNNQLIGSRKILRQ